MIRLVRLPPASFSPYQMYDSVSDFLRTLSTDSPGLWGVFVLGVMATLSLGLYALWEVVLGLVSRLGQRVTRSRQTDTGSGRS